MTLPDDVNFMLNIMEISIEEGGGADDLVAGKVELSFAERTKPFHPRSFHHQGITELPSDDLLYPNTKALQNFLKTGYILGINSINNMTIENLVPGSYLTMIDDWLVVIKRDFDFDVYSGSDARLALVSFLLPSNSGFYNLLDDKQIRISTSYED